MRAKRASAAALCVLGLWGAVQRAAAQSMMSMPPPAAVVPRLPDTPPTAPAAVAPPPADAGHTTPSEGCEGGIVADAEYLLLRPRRGAFDFAIVDPNAAGVPEGSVKSLDYDATSGVRAGVGYRLPGEGWEVGTEFTYLHANANENAAQPAGGTLFATLTHPGAIEQVGSAGASAGLDYRVLDVDVGRSFECGCVSGRVFAGGRFAWINQNLDVGYDGIDANQALVSSHIDFDGAGLRVGGEGRWNIRWGLGLYGRASAALLAGDFKTRLLETNNGGASVNVNVDDNFHKFVPVTELGVGLCWQYRTLVVSAGYEMSNWFGLVDSPDFVDDVHQGKLAHRTSDLGLDGLSLRVLVGF